jgi:hypothetical protein
VPRDGDQFAVDDQPRQDGQRLLVHLAHPRKHVFRLADAAESGVGVEQGGPHVDRQASSMLSLDAVALGPLASAGQ